MQIVKRILIHINGMIISFIHIIQNPRVIRRHVLPKSTNKELCILGNGPSLKDELVNNLKFFREKDIIVVNKFCLATEYNLLQPLHYILLDKDFIITSETEPIKSMQLEIRKKFEDETRWNMNLFLPNGKESMNYAQKILNKNSNINVYYFDITVIKGPNLFKNVLYYYGIGMPFAGNVLIAANMVAINMGYKNIKLYGAEHSIHVQAYVNQNNQVALEYNYFDGSSVEVVFWDETDSSKYSKYHEYLDLWRHTFEAYHQVASYALFKKCNIINRTKESYIDAFKKFECKEENRFEKYN